MEAVSTPKNETVPRRRRPVDRLERSVDQACVSSDAHGGEAGPQDVARLATC